MATTEELMAALNDTIPEHTHNVSDSDTYFIIDPITRQVTNTAAAKNVLMQYDHRSEVFTFEIPRYVEGHDMMLCTAVKIHFNNIDSETEQENTGVVDADDLMIDPLNSNNVICNWEITRDCTQIAGILSFIIQYVCVDDDGNVVYEWHSDIYYDIEIRPGRNYDESEVREYTSILEQWRLRLFGEGDSAVTRINETFETKKSELLAESQTQQDEIMAKGAEVLATIPENYTETHSMADEALRKKANAVILSASGESSIFLDDTADNPLIGLNLYGKTTQVHTNGYQLFDASRHRTYTTGGATVTNNGDGSFTISGSGALANTFSIKYELTHEETLALLKTGMIYRNSFNSNPFFAAYIYYNTSNYHVLVDKDVSSREITQEMLAYSDAHLRVYFYGEPGSNIVAGTIKPMLYQDGDGTWEPYSGGYASPSPDWPQPPVSIETPTVSMYGKNLLNDSEMIATHTAGGITCDYEGNGIFHIYGTYTHVANSIQLSTCYPNIPIDPNRKYTLHGKLIEGSIPGTYHPYVGLGSPTVSVKNWMPLYMNNENVSVGETIIYSGIPKVYLADANRISRFWIYHYNPEMTNYTADFRIQVWLTADDGSEFQPSDEKQTITSTRTLHGVPVSQNGNYTDSNGQQWICDEIDFERGKFIQRLAALTFDGTETWRVTGDKYICTNVELLAPRSLNGYYTHGLYRYDYAGHSIFAVDNTIYLGQSLSSEYGTNVDTWKTFLVNQHEAGIPVQVLYSLVTPIETDLTAAELQAFRALRTNATNTTILNNQNSMMSVKYVADLKRYIDKNVTIKEDEFELVLREANWVSSSDGRYYTQVIDYQPRHNGRITLCPTAAQQVSLILDGIAMFVANENGVATAYCISSTPGRDMTIQATESVVVFI